jgi:hypothetical protein
MSSLASVRRATTAASAASQRRNQEIRRAHEAGHSIRAIAAAAGLSHGRVHQILHDRR